MIGAILGESLSSYQNAFSAEADNSPSMQPTRFSFRTDTEGRKWFGLQTFTRNLDQLLVVARFHFLTRLASETPEAALSSRHVKGGHRP